MKHLLYGLDKNGGFKQWSIEVDPVSQDETNVVVRYSKEGGKVTEKIESVKQGKQSRSVYEQAVSQMNGKLKKQIDKGYRYTKEELNDLPVLAMLATDYNKNSHKIDWDYRVYGSPKMDGVRCLVKKVDGVIYLESRTGQPYDVPRVQNNEHLNDVMVDGDILDGELYVHGYSLEQIVSAVKRVNAREVCEDTQDPSDFIIAELRDKMEFVLFDIYNADMQYEDRICYLDYYCDNDVVTVVDIVRLENEDHMKGYHDKFVKLGYEGIMTRNWDGMYEPGKRSNDLQKYKEFVDSEFIVIDVIPDKDGHGKFVVKNSFADNTFDVVGGKMKERDQWLADKDNIIGKWITVKYQSLYKDTKIPQFPTFVAFRDCNDSGEVVE